MCWFSFGQQGLQGIEIVVGLQIGTILHGLEGLSGRLDKSQLEHMT